MGLLDLKSNLSRENFKRQVDERLPSKEEQAIIDVQDRTRAREKQIAEIRNTKPTPDKMGKNTGLFSTTPVIDVFNESPPNQPKPTDFFQNTNAKGFTRFKKQKDTDFVVNNEKVNTDGSLIRDVRFKIKPFSIPPLIFPEFLLDLNPRLWVDMQD